MNIDQILEEACKQYAENENQAYDFRQGAIFMLKTLLEWELNGIKGRFYIN